MWIFGWPHDMIFVILASLCSFWPYLAGFHHHDSIIIENSHLSASLHEQPLNREGSLVALCFLVPMILDELSNVLERWSFGHEKKKKDIATEMLHDLEKLIVFVGFAIVPCLAFVSPDSYDDSMPLLWICLTRFQTVTVLGTLYCSFSRLNYHMLPWWMSSTILPVTILTVALNISTWTSITDNDSTSMGMVSIALTLVVLVIILIPSGYWLLCQCMIRFNFNNHKVNPNDDGNESIDNKTETNYPDLYLLFVTSSFIVVLLTSLILGSVSQFTPEMILTYKSSFIIVEILLLFIYMRKCKYDSISNLSASMESRKQYLRYIAHELRTPLNSAVLGLKLICDSLATIENKGI